MLKNFWSRPRHLRFVFLGVMVFLASTFGCVTWWLLDQDQQLSSQRVLERQTAAADHVVSVLDKRLFSVEQNLDQILGGAAVPVPAPGAVFLRFQPDAVTSWPEHGLAYSLIPAQAPEAPNSTFLTADRLEFQERNYAAAIDVLRESAASTDPKVRAAALARLARNYRKDGGVREALEASRQLTLLQDVSVAGLPAALAGQLGALYAMDAQADAASAAERARKLRADLNSGRWRLSQAAYSALSEELVQWLPGEPERPERQGALMAGVEWVWQEWRQEPGMAAGRRILSTPSGSLLLQWKMAGKAAAAFVADTDYLTAEWLPEVRRRFDDLQMDLSLADVEGHLVLGKAADAAGRPTIRLASDTALPWTIQVFSTSNDQTGTTRRRNLLLLSMGSLTALILTGAWVIGHAVSRELSLARLKTDFVSTVSHEFRTPLTTLCQLSELLHRDRVATEADRRQYFELLYAESNRLRRLVESLLNFGRLEAGKLQFHFEPLDVASFVRDSAAAFTAAQQAGGHRFEIEVSESPIVRGDRETLQCVMWNLFENAVKYSPEADTVWVSISKSGDRVEIAVRDQGLGIPRDEQFKVFDKFTRGLAAQNSNIRGTGIGLAMAREIVRTHGGDITVKSDWGKGSTFRVRLPVVEGCA